MYLQYLIKHLTYFNTTFQSIVLCARNGKTQQNHPRFTTGAVSKLELSFNHLSNIYAMLFLFSLVAERDDRRGVFEILCFA